MNQTVLNLIGRKTELFAGDIDQQKQLLADTISSSSFLVLGAAGSIGQAVSREIFSRNPKRLHLVDISENNLVEAVRIIRSTFGYSKGEFKTFALDIGSDIYDNFIQSDGKYDYILNLSALKHVRSEKDPFTLMRMIDVNIFNTEKTIRQAIRGKAKKYFCVSTDKAANPANMMGASKRIMEMFVSRNASEISISMSRFANVAFSDGSLLHGFNQRFAKRHPITAPRDVQRYFVTPRESGELCLLSCLLGDNLDIFFPKLTEELRLTTFPEIAVRFLAQMGYEVVECASEDEARSRFDELFKKGKWPCYFFKSDTTGEKDFEEFFTPAEVLDLERFHGIGIIKNKPSAFAGETELFETEIRKLRKSGRWRREDLIQLFNRILPEFAHKETGKFLDDIM